MTRPKLSDTIVAIATPAGIGGIGMIRISGKQARPIGETIVQRELIARYAMLCSFNDKNNKTIDKGIAIYFPAPNSYNGEDIVELHCHGSPVILQMLLSYILRLGARSAEAGEFSRRAFVNGKSSLNQISAVADMVHSASERSLRAAQRVMQGAFSQQVTELCEQMKELRAQLETSLDFPDEEVDVIADDDIRNTTATITNQVQQLQRLTTQGMHLKNGLTIAIVGRPNAGKSSLLNCLAQHEVAIVNALPGTTRDIVRCDILLDGILVTLMDTAGLRSINDEVDAVEQEGIVRAEQASENADITIVLIDVSTPACSQDDILIERLRTTNQPHIVAYNKSDLIEHQTADQPTDRLYISAKTNTGIDTLYQAIKEVAGISELADDAMIVNTRYMHQIQVAYTKLQHIQQQIQQEPIARDTLAFDLNDVYVTLVEMLGEYPSEELLGDIFSRFCIGK